MRLSSATKRGIERARGRTFDGNPWYVYRAADGPGAFGAPPERIIVGQVLARWKALTREQSMGYALPTERRVWRVTVPPDADVIVGDRLGLGNRPASGEVIAVEASPSGGTVRHLVVAGLPPAGSDPGDE